MPRRQPSAMKSSSRADEVAVHVGRRLKLLRTRRHGGKLTQGEIARKAGLSVSFLSMVERGERTASLETLDALAFALGVPLMELFHFREEMASPHPSTAKLIDFARERALGRDQIDQLLAVARAMFN